MRTQSSADVPTTDSSPAGDSATRISAACADGALLANAATTPRSPPILRTLATYPSRRRCQESLSAALTNLNRSVGVFGLEGDVSFDPADGWVVGAVAGVEPQSGTAMGCVTASETRSCM